jgi:hypothetical protein
MTPGMSATVFDVWAHAAGNMHRIVLVEELDRLDCDELVAIRAGLRVAPVRSRDTSECPRTSNNNSDFPGQRQQDVQKGGSRTVEVAKDPQKPIRIRASDRQMLSLRGHRQIAHGTFGD